MKDFPEDLSARSRRGVLGESDERRLALTLESSLESKLLHQAGKDFDAEDSMLPGDDALADRVTRRVMTRLREERALRAGRRRPSRWAVALAAAFVSAVATAGTFIVVRQVELEVPSQPAAAVTPAAKSAPTPQSARVVTPAPEPSAAAEAEPKPLAPPRAKSERASDGAAALFASAALARREGSPGAAIALYDELQTRFPASAESRAADLALGMLHLQRGEAKRALSHFQRSRRQSPRGQTASEALWGEAQALSRLGRAADASRAYQELLDRYPSSPYATAARAKLESGRSKP